MSRRRRDPLEMATERVVRSAIAVVTARRAKIAAATARREAREALDDIDDIEVIEKIEHDRVAFMKAQQSAVRSLERSVKALLALEEIVESASVVCASPRRAIDDLSRS